MTGRENIFYQKTKMCVHSAARGLAALPRNKL